MADSSNPNSVETPSGPRVRRGGSSGIRRATRLEKVQREERIVGLLNRGASVPEIAASEGLTLKRMRNVVRDILSERMPQPPAEFLALQDSPLNEARRAGRGRRGRRGLARSSPQPVARG